MWYEIWAFIFLSIFSIPLVCFIYVLSWYIINFISFKIKVSKLDITETSVIPDYSANIVAYIMNNKRFSRRQIVATLGELIDKGALKISYSRTIPEDFKLTWNQEIELEEYENNLLNHLFVCFDENLNMKKKKELTKDELKREFYKGNLSSEICKHIYKSIEKNVNKYDFFDGESEKKKKSKTELVVLISSFCFFIPLLIITLLMIVSDWIFLIPGISDIYGIFITMFSWLFPKKMVWMINNFYFLPVLIMILNFVIYRVTIYIHELNLCYSDLTDQGKVEFIKLKGLKKFLKKYRKEKIKSNNWKKYYWFSIVLKCNKKFSINLIKNGVISNENEVIMLEMFENIVKFLKKEPLYLIESGKYYR